MQGRKDVQASEWRHLDPSWLAESSKIHEKVRLMSVLLGYLDPGTGAFVLQVLLAGALGAGMFFRNAVFSTIRLFKLRRPSQEPIANQDSDRGEGSR